MTATKWIARHPLVRADMLGLVPEMLSESDPRPAREQLDEGYRHGGGWQPFPGWKMDAQERLRYPGDPPILPLAETRLRDERVILYEHEIVAIVQPDNSFEACRMD